MSFPFPCISFLSITNLTKHILQQLPIFKFDYTFFILHLPQKYSARQLSHSIFFIIPMTFLSFAFVPLSHSAFHRNCCTLCRVLSCAPTMPYSDNLALSFYILWSDKELLLQNALYH